MTFTFQVGMLPRAGSAWMATLLNMHQDVFCFHDALQSFDGKYEDAAASKFYKEVGDSSSYVCATPHIPGRSIYIARDPKESFISMKQLGLQEGWEKIVQVCEAWSKDCPIFQFNDIFGKDQEKAITTLTEIFKIIVPEVLFNPEKAVMLRTLKVELLVNGPEVFDIEQIKGRVI